MEETDGYGIARDRKSDRQRQGRGNRGLWCGRSEDRLHRAGHDRQDHRQGILRGLELWRISGRRRRALSPALAVAEIRHRSRWLSYRNNPAAARRSPEVRQRQQLELVGYL